MKRTIRFGAIFMLVVILSISLALPAAASSNVSIQMQMAQQQVALQQAAAAEAQEVLDEISALQEEHEVVEQYIEEAYNLQSEAKASNGTTLMPEDMTAFMDKNGLDYDTTGNDLLHDKEEWEVAISSLTQYASSISDQIQTRLIYVQSYMGQYNSYTQGADSSVVPAGSTIQGVSTMLGDGGTDMLFTGLLVGAAAGIIGTLLVQRTKKSGQKE